jgi:hypothetical protein
VTIPPESVEVGKCYLDARHRVLHVTHVTLDGRVRFKYQEAHLTTADAWWAGMLNLREFASETVRQVPCDWTPERGE